MTKGGYGEHPMERDYDYDIICSQGHQIHVDDIDTCKDSKCIFHKTLSLVFFHLAKRLNDELH